MQSRVGVLLDEIPEEMRDRVVETLIDRPESFWEELARRQVRLTKRRLNFRNFVYPDKGQLPLPPAELWSLQLGSAGPSRENIDGHDLLLTDYTFSSILLTGENSPAASEPALREIGGRWEEPFILPIDPDLLLQRTGNACLNEAGFPPNSFDSENTWLFYDYTCQGASGGILGCHRTRLNSQSCLEALTSRVGTIETQITFERLPWDTNLADEVRLGELTQADAPDIKVVGKDLEDNRIIYRYFPPDSCALAEQCVVSSGWRRLLQFSATIQNVGAEPLDIGPVVSENPLQTLFQYNTCHAHYHFSNYGDFFLNAAEENLSSKQAFCVESTNRFSNNEWSPLTHSFRCLSQGVQAGWVDEYAAGLDCQWIDITDIDIPDEGSSVTLGFDSNPDQFLCEGTPALDDNGNPIWEPTGLTAPNGTSVDRPQCEFTPNWDVNNSASLELFVPATGSFVTEECSDSLLGPRRNCGFQRQLDAVLASEEGGDDSSVEAAEGAFSCTPGEPVQLTCTVESGEAAQTLRACEYSTVLGTGVACTYLNALGNAVIGEDNTPFSFTCPMVRDEDEPGGRFALYGAPVFDGDSHAPVSCTIAQ
jgi:hypothetical protein